MLKAQTNKGGLTGFGLILFLVLCISGNPLFIYSSKLVYLITALLLLVVCACLKKNVISKKLIIIMISYAILAVCRFVFVDSVSIMADINILLKIFIAFLTCSIVGYEFRKIYFNLMVIICAVSLVFSLLYYITGLQLGLAFDRYKTILFFNTLPNSIETEGYRNAAMFWEPGAFQGYIMLAFLLYVDTLKSLVKKNPISCIILLFSLFSTKSTTAYIVLMFFSLSYFLVDKRVGIGIRAVLSLLLLCIVCVSVFKLDFMGSKISNEMETALAIGEDGVNWSRTGSLILDLANLERHPLIGNGHLMEMRYMGFGDDMSGVSNGLTGAANMYGIPFVLFYFVLLFMNFSPFGMRYQILIVLTVILLLFGEYFLNYPLFWALLFVKNKLPSASQSIKYEKNCSPANGS